MPTPNLTDHHRAYLARFLREAILRRNAQQRRGSADFVEKVCGEWGAVSIIGDIARARRASRRSWLWHRDELGEFPEILGGGCKVELVAGAVRTA